MSIQIKNIQKIKILKNSKGVRELKVSFLNLDMKNMLKMKKKSVKIEDEYGES